MVTDTDTDIRTWWERALDTPDMIRLQTVRAIHHFGPGDRWLCADCADVHQPANGRDRDV